MAVVLDNLFLKDGTELICFRDAETHIVKSFYGDDDERGILLFRGSYVRCKEFMHAIWTQTAQDLTG